MRTINDNETRVRQLEERMSGLNDSLTIGILLLLIFGAVSFYLYSKMIQNEKRVSLLENLLVSLKMSTEASLGGPDSVEPIGGPIPLHDVEYVEEEDYAEMLKEMPMATKKEETTSIAQESSEGPLALQRDSKTDSSASDASADVEAEAEALLRSLPIEIKTESTHMDANYESMTLKELQALVKQRGLNGIPQRKRDLIDALKRQGFAPPVAPTPLEETNSFAFEESGISLEEM
jgi:hypothetical protein